jgi:signal transduction histidine kinase
MSILLRLLLLLTAITAVLFALIGSGLLSRTQTAAAETRLIAVEQQQALLLRGQVATLRAQSGAMTLLNGDRGGRDQALGARADLQRELAGYRAAAGADAGAYGRVADRFLGALARLLDAYDRGGARAIRGAPAADLRGAGADLAAAQEELLGHSGADLAAASVRLDETRDLVRLESSGAAAAGVVLILLLALINFLRTTGPTIALARQARKALRAPLEQMPHFTLPPHAPQEARQLAHALNSLVAQLRQKYLDLEQVNAELHELNEEARAAGLAKTTFIATISHELRTPLNAMIGFAELLATEAHGPLLPKQRQQAERILRNSQHLLILINDVLDLSRVEAGKVSLTMAPVDVPALFGGLTGVIEPLARQKGLEVHVETPPSLPPLVTDETRLRQVLLNLLSNAVKFTRQGRVTLTVETDHNLPNWLIFRVRDTGIGIAPAELNRIWGEFYQISSGLSRTAGGSGLGLAIVYKLMDLLGGDLDVQSVEGEGSVFGVYLPLTPSTSRDGAAGASLFAATGVYSARP